MENDSIIVPRHVQARRDAQEAAQKMADLESAERAAKREADPENKVGAATNQRLPGESAKSGPQSAEEAGIPVRTTRTQPAEQPGKP